MSLKGSKSFLLYMKNSGTNGRGAANAGNIADINAKPHNT
jgi:hypothetical protein